MRQTTGLLLALTLAACSAASPSASSPSSTPAELSDGPAAPYASAITAPSPATSSPTASSLPPGTYENKLLGYRMTFPTGYRRSMARIFTGQVNLGVDFYTLTTEQEARDACAKDGGDLPPRLDHDPDVRVGVMRNEKGLSAMQWATTPLQPGGWIPSTHQKVEATTIDGHEAVRLVADNAGAETNEVVIRAGDRIYDISPTQGPPPRQRWLDDIVRTFTLITPAPFPSPTATIAPRVAATQTAAALADALAARDVDRVVPLLPDCRINVVHTYDDRPPLGMGALWRSVPLFTAALRQRFAAGDLTVTVDPVIQFDERDDLFFARSSWTCAGNTKKIDLYVTELDGRWSLLTARIHFPTFDTSVRYPSPWTDGSC